MRRAVFGLVASCLVYSTCLHAAQVKGKVVDPSGAPIPSAQVSIVTRVGVESTTASSASGTFELQSDDRPDARLVVNAPGFSTRTLELKDAATVQLEIAPQVNSVRVVGSSIDVPVNEQGGSA